MLLPKNETRGTWLMERMTGFDSVERLPGLTWYFRLKPGSNRIDDGMTGEFASCCGVNLAFARFSGFGFGARGRRRPARYVRR